MHFKYILQFSFLCFTEDHISFSSGDEPELTGRASKSPTDMHFHAAGDRLASPKLSGNTIDDVPEQQISQPQTPPSGVEKVRDVES